MFWIDENNSIGTLCLSDPDEGFASLGEFTNIAEARKWSKQTVTDVWNGFAGTAGPFADLKPRKCFKNRPYGLAKIWAAIQRLAPADAASEPGAPSEPTARECPDCEGTGENCANCGGAAGNCVCDDADEEMGTCDTCGGSGQVVDEPENPTGKKTPKPATSTTPILDAEVKVKGKKKAAKKSPKAKRASKSKGDGKTKRDEVIRLMSRAKGASTEELLDATGWFGHSLRGFVSTLGSKGGYTIVSEKDEKRGRVYRIAA